MSRIKLIAVLTLVGLVLLFAVQNAETVEIRMLLWSFDFPRSLLLFLVLLIGFVAGWILHSAMKLTATK